MCDSRQTSKNRRRVPLTIFLLCIPALAVDYSDSKISPNKGKPNQNLKIAFSSENCKSATPAGDFSAADATATGADIDLTVTKAKGCVIEGSLKVHADASPGDVQIIFKPTPDVKVLVPFTILDPNTGPIPPGLKPAVDVQWDILDDLIAKDNFGRRVSNNFYAIQVTIGNDSGYALQIAGIGFQPKVLADLGVLQTTLPNSSYVIARGVLENEQVVSTRNVIDRSLAGASLILAGLTPFFHAPGPKANYAAAVAVFANPLIQAYDKILPDKTITELKRLDDYSLRDGLVIPNNTHLRTIIFFQKALVRQMVNLRKTQATQPVATNTADIESAKALIQQALMDLKNKLQETQEDLTKRVSQQLDAMRQMSPLSDLGQLQKLHRNVEQIARKAGAVDTKLKVAGLVLSVQSANAKLAQAVAVQAGDAKQIAEQTELVMVRMELNRLVLVGDQIEYINRVHVDSSAPPTGVQPPPTIDQAVIPTQGATRGDTTSITLTGSHLAGATVAPQDTSGNIKVDKVGADPNGKYVTFSLAVDEKYTSQSVTVLVSTPGIGSPVQKEIPVADLPVVRSVSPTSVPKSGGDVKVSGIKLTGVKAYIQGQDTALTTKDQTDKGFTVSIPQNTADQITLVFKTSDSKAVSGPAAQQTIQLTAATPTVSSVNPKTLAKAGGDVEVSGTNLTGVQAYIDNPTKPLAVKNPSDTKFTVTVPAQSGTQVTLKFQGPDKKDVQTPQTITITP